jgi:hypothetical protein
MNPRLETAGSSIEKTNQWRLGQRKSMWIDRNKQLTAAAPDSVDSRGGGGGCVHGDRGGTADDGNTGQGRGVAVAARSGKRREITGGGGAGARAQGGNELKCPSRQPPETSIGRGSVRGGKLEILRSARDFYRRL